MEGTRPIFALLADWCDNLAARIESELKLKDKVIIMALSRRGSHLCRLLRNIPPSLDGNLNRAFQSLDNKLADTRVSWTSEIAAPVISPEHQSGASVIIVDDVINSCTSVLRATNALRAFGWEISSVIPVAVSEDSPVVAQDKDFFKSAPNILNEDAFSTLVGELSELVNLYALPSDIELPQVNVQLGYSDILNHFRKSNEKGLPHYEMDRPEDTRSFTVVLTDESINSYNNDFAKIRVFENGKDACIIEPIAPNVLSGKDLALNESLFENPAYRELWQDVRNRALANLAPYLDGNRQPDPEEPSDYPELRVNLLYRTLAVWANYLFSLSSFIRHKDLFLRQGTSVSTSDDDIALLAGNTLARTLATGLSNLVETGEESPSRHRAVLLPAQAVTKGKEGEYMRAKYMVMSSSLSVEENLDNLFKASRFDSQLQAGVAEGALKGRRYVFGETFESLFEELRLFAIVTESVRMRVYKWVDRAIDAGVVKPSYELVEATDGNLYFRRFFLSGMNKEKLS